MRIFDIHWYEKEYGEDWAKIVRDEDIRLGRNSDGTYTINKNPITPDAHWAGNSINMQ